MSLTILLPLGTLYALAPSVKTRLAIPTWEDAVSTVFDFAARLLIVELEDNREVSRTEIPLPAEPPISRGRRLSQLGVSVLICGAISQTLAAVVAGMGIQIIPFVSGPVDTVLPAYLSGQLINGRFLLPGYLPGARRRWRRGRGFHGGRW